MKRTGLQPFVPAFACLAGLLTGAGIALSTHSGYNTVTAATVTSGASSATNEPTVSTVSGAAPAPLVQLDPCAGSAAPTQQATTAQPGGGTQVSFRILPSAVAQIDRNGVITAVATNTGCIPQSWNSFYVLTPDGAYDPASASDVNQLLGATYSGDWTTPGLFHQFS